MKIKLLGVRGSLPSPLGSKELQEKIVKILQQAKPEDLRDERSIRNFVHERPFHLNHTYGGDTTCTEIRTMRNNNLIVVDAGTGIRDLGDRLIREEGFGEGGREIHIFITHTHWDHIQGFPFFVPAYIPGNTIHFYSPFPDLEERFQRQQLFDHFPQPLEGMASRKEFHLIQPSGSLSIDGLTISCFPLNHPGSSYAYRFVENGRSFIFATDAEFTMVQIDELDYYNPFFKGTDILVLDSQYTIEEAFYKFDWGHTSYTMAVNLGISWDVGELILTHHDPSYNDEKLSTIHQEALEHQKNMRNSSMKIHQAYQGMEMVLE